MCGESIAGIQAEGVISTTKHFSLNCNETNRHWLDAVIDPAETRREVAAALHMLDNKRERLPHHKHGNTPL